MGQTNWSNNFIIYNVVIQTLREMQNILLMRYICVLYGNVHGVFFF